MFRLALLATIFGAIAAVGGCDHDPMSERGFRLPEGDPVAGCNAFVYKN